VTYLSNFESFSEGVKRDFDILAFEAAQHSGRKTLVVDRSVLDAGALHHREESSVRTGSPKGGVRSCFPHGDAPPQDNMGAQITEGKIDWLSFTVPALEDIDLIGIVAKWSSRLCGAVPLDRGRYGYPCARAVLGTGIILWNPDRPEMGVHVELPSKALAVFVGSTGETIYSILVDAMGESAKFKRIDVCSDNHELPISKIIEAVENGLLVTRSRDVSLMQKYKRWGGREMIANGATLYIGAATSDRRVRFYDKAAEQGLDDGSVWTRAEVQLRDDLAHQTVIALLVTDTDLESVIASAVDFRLQDDSNTSRRTRCDWWELWLGQFKRFHYKVARRLSLIGDAVDWINNQVAPTLAYIFQGVGYDFAASWLVHVISSSVDRIPGYRLSHLAAIGES
jgi:hypothetical protein